MEEENSATNPSVDDGVWTYKVEELLRDWRRRVLAAQQAHYRSADLFRLFNYLLGVPAIIFSSIVGTAIFAGLEKDSPRTLIVASASIIAAVLTGLQTFLRFPERALQHAKAGAWYSAIRRDIEQTLHLPKEVREKAKDFVDKTRKEINRVSQDSPELRTGRWESYAERFGVEDYQKPPDDDVKEANLKN